MADLPNELVAFHSAMQRLVAVREVSTGLKWLAHYGPDTYSLPAEFGDMPHALLRRTGGGLKDEAWAPTEFELFRDEGGWLTLEFLAWWVRDNSRGGGQIQMRPMALPPQAYEVQFGRTLRFIIDHFAVCPGGVIDPMLHLMQERAESLTASIDCYAAILGELVRPTVSTKELRPG